MTTAIPKRFGSRGDWCTLDDEGDDIRRDELVDDYAYEDDGYMYIPVCLISKAVEGLEERSRNRQ